MNLTPHDVTAPDGTLLRVWEDPPEGDTPPDEAVLFVHGAITHSRALFAPPVEGDDSYSWLRATADAGRTAYTLDVRGYGDSEFPPEMDDPPESNDPPILARDAESDVAAAFDFAAERHDAIHLVGVSWGTMTTGRFLAERDRDVASYVQCAPVYDPPYEFEDGISALGLDPDLDAYFVDHERDVRERQDGDEDPALFEAVWRAMVESGQGDAADREYAYVAQTGALADVKACCAGDPPYDPGEIAAPTLVVRGSDDDTSQRSDALTLYDELGAADDRKEYAELAGADHYAMHGDRRRALYDLTTAFHDRNRTSSDVGRSD
ncbi:alpha/beta hydrolase [Halorussus salinisoli]|uniref:alpha/beta hydrolase n=1 Tax=Halorussus salinisoli TaxID=2558242 RepID=UPI0010C17FCE|nr:alpha/beta fold hydrolase [Halorussus salinisoli]